MLRSRRQKSSPFPQGAKGYRAYVVGDIHGCLDLLERLIGLIERDLELRPARKTVLVFVGDLIDRGPASAQVLERLRTYRRNGVHTLFLLGNHEEVMLRILGGEGDLIDSWLTFGGAQCLESYGLDPSAIHSMREDEAIDAIRAAVPEAQVQFLRDFHDSFRFGDYVIVHAGIRPGIELEQQRQSDLRWIRDPFLLNDQDHGFVVVHGHTISEAVDERANRIGIDTGAYATGRLTALAIEAGERWYLDTSAPRDSSVMAVNT